MIGLLLKGGSAGDNMKPEEQSLRSAFLEMLFMKVTTIQNVEGLDE